jgi:hypothetical protein
MTNLKYQHIIIKHIINKYISTYPKIGFFFNTKQKFDIDNFFWY